MKWRNISWTEYVNWVQGKRVIDGSGCYNNDWSTAVVIFDDGSKACMKSNYQAFESGSYAEEPTVMVLDSEKA